jgi:hypothetical protein
VIAEPTLPMPLPEVEERLARVNTAAEAMFEALAEATRDDLVALYQGRAWESLGLASWEELCDQRVGKRLRLQLVERRETVAALTAAGLSTRAIGAAIGVHHTTVVNDRKATGENSPVDAPVPDPPAPVVVVGLDGRKRTYDPKPEPPPPPPAPVDPFAGWSRAELDALAEFQATGRSIVVNMSTGASLGPRLWAWAETNGTAERIDRRTRWGNPFEIPDDGHRDTVISAYRDHYLPHKPSLLAALPDLRGKILGCWCAPLPCHGDTLIEAAYA